MPEIKYPLFEDEVFTQSVNRVDLLALNQLRIYDAGIQKWLVNLVEPLGTTNPDLKDKPGSIPVVYATPDRAFAEYRRVLSEIRKMHGLPPLPEDVMTLKYVSLPFISFYRSSEEFVQDRPWRRFILNLGYVDGQTKEEMYQMHWPLPYDIRYEIELWSRTVEVMRLLSSLIYLQFEPFEAFMKVDLTPILPTLPKDVIIPITYEGMAERSELEPGEPENRLIRRTIHIRVKGWLFKQPWKVKTMLKFEPVFEVQPTTI